MGAVQKTIEAFNNLDRSMLTLENAASKTVLLVCGKADALIVSWKNNHNEPPYMTMCADKPRGGRIELLCGQLADFESDIVVTRQEANDAIECFILTGQMTPLHRWREE